MCAPCVYGARMSRAILFLLAAGCNGDTPTPTDTGTAPLPVYDPTWAGVQELFVDHCDRCHPSKLIDIDLHTGIPYDLAYYQIWVKPGEPEQSLLWLLVSDQLPLSMPFDTDPLPLAVVDPIRVWIENGASLE
jgi:hypothetical protein